MPGAETAAADIACTLEATDFATRVEDWRDLARTATSRRTEPGRLTTIYPGGESVRVRLTRLIEAESACCPFLAFEMYEEGDSIRVEVTFPEEAEAMIGQVIGAL